MSLATLFLFVMMSAAIIAIPGPTVLLALQNGSRHGLQAAFWGMAGAVLADALLVTAVACGLRPGAVAGGQRRVVSGAEMDGFGVPHLDRLADAARTPSRATDRGRR